MNPPSKLVLSRVNSLADRVKHALVFVNPSFEADRLSAALLFTMQGERLTRLAFQAGQKVIFGDFSILETTLTSRQREDMNKVGSAIFADPLSISCLVADVETGRLKTARVDLSDVEFDPTGFMVAGVEMANATWIFSQHISFKFLDSVLATHLI